MMQELTPKVRSWASIAETQAVQQAIRTAHMDQVYPYLAIMPDIHFGKGCCVGVAIPTVGAIFPAAVGVDAGCGMCAVLTQFCQEDLPWAAKSGSLRALREMIERSIPLSAGNYNHHVDGITRAYVEELEAMEGAAQATAIAPNWHLQIKSLGSGNHFLEVTVDEQRRIWLFLHSGSRGVGNRLMVHHIRVAQDACKGIALPDRDLAYLTEGTQEFDDYIRDLRWSQRFAYLNRQAMMDQLVSCFEQWIGSQVRRLETINCHHNYTERIDLTGSRDTEHDEAWLSRKGAINAELGRPGLIPGSMGAASYVVSGLGNMEAFCTAPHGAGRMMSRGEAKRSITMEQLEEQMQGIEWSHRTAFLDEAPDAYKDIDRVIEDAADLVEVRHTLHQVLNVKGT